MIQAAAHANSKSRWLRAPARPIASVQVHDGADLQPDPHMSPDEPATIYIWMESGAYRDKRYNPYPERHVPVERRDRSDVR